MGTKRCPSCSQRSPSEALSPSAGARGVPTDRHQQRRLALVTNLHRWPSRPQPVPDGAVAKFRVGCLLKEDRGAAASGHERCGWGGGTGRAYGGGRRPRSGWAAPVATVVAAGTPGRTGGASGASSVGDSPDERPGGSRSSSRSHAPEGSDGPAGSGGRAGSREVLSDYLTLDTVKVAWQRARRGWGSSRRVGGAGSPLPPRPHTHTRLPGPRPHTCFAGDSAAYSATVLSDRSQ